MVSLYDLGSYLKIDLAFGAEADPGHAFLELYPVDARPLVLGFHPDLEWGTKDEFPKNFRRGAAPGAKLGLKLPSMYAFIGAKSALIKSPLEVELESEGDNKLLFSTRTYYGVLGGLGLTLAGFTAELNGGFFQKGTLTKEGVIGKPIQSGGGSVRLGYAHGAPIGLRIDSGLYRRSTGALVAIEPDPTAPRSKVDWSVSGEGNLLVQTLNDFDRPGSTDFELAWAGLLDAKLRAGLSPDVVLRAHLEGRLRSLTTITAQVPGFFPYSTLPDGSETMPEIQALLSVDVRLFDLVTPAITAGLRLPATYRGLPPAGSGADTSSEGVHTVVVSSPDAGGWYILPAGKDATPVWWVEVAAKLHPAPELTLLFEVLYGQDANRTQVERNAKGHAVRVYTEPNVVALNLMGQLAF